MDRTGQDRTGPDRTGQDRQLDVLQRRVLDNKKRRGFNTTNIHEEFCYLYGEVAEAFDAYKKGKDDLGDELADTAIFLMGIAEILGFSLQEEIEKKVEINEKRKFIMVNGVMTKVQEGDSNTNDGCDFW